MMSLLWLITVSLGLRLIYEQSYDVRRLTGLRLRRFTLWATVSWWGWLLWTAVWWGQP